MTTFIAVVSGKGGLGKTSFTLNLASALESFSRSTLIVDLHLTKPNLGLYLGYMNPPKTVNSALNGSHKMYDAIYTHPSGIDLIPADSSLSKPKVYSTQQISDALLDLLNKAEVVLIDTPDLQDCEPILRACDSAIVLTQANLVAVSDTLKAISLLNSIHKKILGAVIMQSRKRHFDLAVDDMQSVLRTKLIGEVPYDETVEHAHSLKHPVVYAHSQTPASIAYKKIAANLIGQTYEDSLQKKMTFWEYLKKRSGFE